MRSDNDILFLDVEGTLIESMDSPVFLNNKCEGLLKCNYILTDVDIA